MDVLQESSSQTQGPMVLRYMRSSWTSYQNVVVLDTDSPPPPQQLTVRPISHRDEIHVSWVVPQNDQGDVTSLTLYRRGRRGDVFTSNWSIIADRLPVSNGMVRDLVPWLEHPDEVVYAMTSTSIHGQVSSLSEQISCTLVRRGDERDSTLISLPGALLTAHGQFSVIPFNPVRSDVICRRGFTISPRTGESGYMNSNKGLVIRIQSLDTGEVSEKSLNIDYINFIDAVDGQLKNSPTADLVVPSSRLSAPLDPASSFGV
jgi:hypothetical protein